jgi:hypothetical protein
MVSPDNDCWMVFLRQAPLQGALHRAAMTVITVIEEDLAVSA